MWFCKKEKEEAEDDKKNLVTQTILSVTDSIEKLLEKCPKEHLQCEDELEDAQ